jgi:hypothetical protein
VLDRNTPGRGLFYGCLLSILSWWLLAAAAYVLAALLLAVLR